MRGSLAGAFSLVVAPQWRSRRICCWMLGGGGQALHRQSLCGIRRVSVSYSNQCIACCRARQPHQGQADQCGGGPPQDTAPPALPAASSHCRGRGESSGWQSWPSAASRRARPPSCPPEAAVSCTRCPRLSQGRHLAAGPLHCLAVLPIATGLGDDLNKSSDM